MTPLALRRLTPDDAEAVSALSQQLGYELDAQTAVPRIELVLTSAGHHAFGAFAGERLVGFLHCYDRPSIEKGRALVVQALVVDESARGSGAGRFLMAEAERLAGEIGCASVTLSSNMRRTGAHAFYERIGYSVSSTSRIFSKVF